MGIPEEWRVNMTSYRQMRQLVTGNWPYGEQRSWQDIQRAICASWTRKDPDWNPHGLDFTWMRLTHQNDPLVPGQSEPAGHPDLACQSFRTPEHPVSSPGVNLNGTGVPTPPPQRSLPTTDLEVQPKRKRSYSSSIQPLARNPAVRSIVPPPQRTFPRSRQSQIQEITPVRGLWAEIDDDSILLPHAENQAGLYTVQDSNWASQVRRRDYAVNHATDGTNAVEEGVQDMFQGEVEGYPVQGAKNGKGDGAEENGYEAEDGDRAETDMRSSLPATQQRYIHELRKAYHLGYAAGNRTSRHSMGEALEKALEKAIDRGTATAAVAIPEGLQVALGPNGNLDSITPAVDEDGVGSEAEGAE